MDKHQMNGDDFFDLWRDSGDEAFAILHDTFETPPSLDVFRYGLEKRREKTRSPLTVKAYAHWLSAEYQSRQEAA